MIFKLKQDLQILHIKLSQNWFFLQHVLAFGKHLKPTLCPINSLILISFK